MSQSLRHLPLRPSTKSLLEKHGFVTVNDVLESKDSGGMSNLAAELGSIDLVKAASIVREVQQAAGTNDTGSNRSNSRKSKSAFAILSAQKHTPRVIVTFSKAIDQLLGGGVAKSEVTEIVGLPGAGKTQLAMQLCVDTRLPVPQGGVEGESIYIDTEGSFSPERCFNMAKALVDHVRSRSHNRQLPDWFNPETILDGIHVYRIYDEATQTATIMSLPKFLDERAAQGTAIKLVVVDSIAFHYRCTTDNYMARTQSLTNVAAFLNQLAARYDLAVVVINQMTTKFDDSSSNDSKHVPALGESWAHATTTRLLLEEVGGHRKCTLVKSPHRAAGTARYQVRDCGVRDELLDDKENRIPKRIKAEGY